MQLSTAALVNNGDGTSGFTSISPINTINLGGKIIGNEANLNVSGPITAGTFKIGKTEFTIDATTTMSTLLNNINKDADAGVTAQFDASTNKLVLTSKNAGKTAINLENGTSNFLTQTGLVTAGGDSLSSQTLGDNAKVYINGSITALEVNSNTITDDISGISGLTINLKNTTAVGTSIDININQDTDQISSALDDFVAKFNAMASTVDSQTAKDKSLHSEYSLISLKNTFRSMASDRVDALTSFNSLSMIGISTGAVGKSATDTSNTLSLDKTKLLAALQKNPSEVKTLLVGDAAAGITGIFQKLETKLTQVLDPVSGYFDARKDSIDTSIANTDKSITRGEERITAYKNMITKQFNLMDQYISKMQQQSTAISSIK
jgi:flagellar hook-associated protein 2